MRYDFTRLSEEEFDKELSFMDDLDGDVGPAAVDWCESLKEEYKRRTGKEYDAGTKERGS